MMKKLLIIDLSSLVHQTPKSMLRLTTSNNIPTGHIYSFTKKLTSLFSNISSDIVIFALDSGYSFRTKINPDYKANRGKKRFRVEDVHPLLFSLPCIIAKKDDHEADDVIYSIVKKLINSKTKISILSKDYDISYLLRYYPKVRHYFTESQEITPLFINMKMGINPKYILLYKAIFGDNSDNISGIKVGWQKSEILKMLTKNPKKVIRSIPKEMIPKVLNNFRLVRPKYIPNIEFAVGRPSTKKVLRFLNSKEIKSIKPSDILGEIPNNLKFMKSLIKELS